MDEKAAEVAAEGTSYLIAYIAGGIGTCGVLLLVLVNLVALLGFMRDKSDETASGMSKASWALGFLSIFLGPCGVLTALVAIVLARIETGKIYRGDSPLRSATPARWGSINGGVFLFLLVITAIGVGMNFLA